MTKSKRKILVGGEWRETPETFEVHNPFDGNLIAEVSNASAFERNEALCSAENAAREMSGLARFALAKGLSRLSHLIEERKVEFASLIVAEAAKPISLARAEVERAIQTFRIAAGEAERFAGEVVPMDAQANGRGRSGFTLRVPLGVIFGITPFNFPLNLVAHKIAPALAARNSIIIKPSPRTPLTALLLGEVFLESGLPKSAVQIVPMNIETIDEMLRDERVKMLSFTGSAEVGWSLKSRAGRKRVALELGGNAPLIIDRDADYERSIDQTLLGGFSYSGQSCISVQRVYVHNEIAGRWIGDFVARAKMLRKGNPTDESTQLSVMIDEAAAIRAEKWINEAVASGAKILCGGNREGAFLVATVLTNTTPEMSVVSEEVFAPVVVVETFSNFEDAVASANNSRFGLQCGVFTQNLTQAQRAAERLEFGGVIINDIPTFRTENMPYGGIKESGFGREGVRYAMEEMSEIRLVVLNS